MGDQDDSTPFPERADAAHNRARLRRKPVWERPPFSAGSATGAAYL